jgi:hypothetical protein
MSAQSYGGLWTIRSSDFPEHHEFMFIDEGRGRIVTFVVVSVEPGKRAVLRLWYRPESATSFAARLRPTDPWRVQEFRLDGDQLSWTYGGVTHTWKRVFPESRPDWLDARLATAYSKMDAMDEIA